MNIENLNRDLNDIKSLITILQHRVTDLENKINHINHINHTNHINYTNDTTINSLEYEQVKYYEQDVLDNEQTTTTKRKRKRKRGKKKKNSTIQNIEENEITDSNNKVNNESNDDSDTESNTEFNNEIDDSSNIQTLDKYDMKIRQNKINGKKIVESGQNYELDVYNILKNCKVSMVGENYIYNLNTQKESEITDNNKKHDLVCNYFRSGKNNVKDITKIPMELKKAHTPDWSQCTLEFNEELNEWQPNSRSNILEKNKNIFAKYLKGKVIFGNKPPIFTTRKFTDREWSIYREENRKELEDVYIDVEQDTIKKLYTNYGCYYIQVSGGYGLYHLGNDIYYFNVPEFKCEQRMRIRFKRNGMRRGNVRLSITAAIQPKNLNNIKKSPYSLDNVKKLPKQLIYVKI
jgi:hypothetical protein